MIFRSSIMEKRCIVGCVVCMKQTIWAKNKMETPRQQDTKLTVCIVTSKRLHNAISWVTFSNLVSVSLALSLQGCWWWLYCSWSPLLWLLCGPPANEEVINDDWMSLFFLFFFLLLHFQYLSARTAGVWDWVCGLVYRLQRPQPRSPLPSSSLHRDSLPLTCPPCENEGKVLLAKPDAKEWGDCRRCQHSKVLIP